MSVEIGIYTAFDVVFCFYLLNILVSGPDSSYYGFMESKYNVPKRKKPESKQEQIQEQIEELVKRRDRISNAAEKAAIQKEIMTLYAQWERLKL